MYIENEELKTAVYAYTLGKITTDDVVIKQAILAAIDEATSYLNGKYDTVKIFNAQGEERNVILLEHCKSIAVWYIIRLGNAQLLFDKAKIYYDNAKDWLEKVAGIHSTGKSIAPDLPLKTEDGQVKSKIRICSKRKFKHHFD